MPVEIKELVIKAVVNEGVGGGGNESNPAGAEAPEKIVEACVERVMQILKDKKER